MSRTCSTSWPAHRSAATVAWDVLVGQQTQGLGGRQRVGPLLAHAVGRESQAGADILAGQLRIFLEQPRLGPAGGEQVEDEVDREPRPADDGLAAEDGWIGGDAVAPGRGGLLGSTGVPP
jgi:hypothetical protein